jgi:hypothetical protein
MMNALDYYNNPVITSSMKRELSYIKNREDREDCSQEIYAEIYTLMPMDNEEAIRLVKRVSEKFKRGVSRILDNETELEEVTHGTR